MFHTAMTTATVRQLRTEFPKIRAALHRNGEVVITERGKESYVLRPYETPKKKKPGKIDYYARLLSYMPKPISAEASRAMNADRDDR